MNFNANESSPSTPATTAAKPSCDLAIRDIRTFSNQTRNSNERLASLNIFHRNLSSQVHLKDLKKFTEQKSQDSSQECTLMFLSLCYCVCRMEIRGLVVNANNVHVKQAAIPASL